ncbi:FabD/lysophospholipase-like protein [Schizophyllum commune H4-8]|nr:FabD/lysophospholipase-like protein [Schizophyllum commune H4-8]KAI5900627.1 FabD/lysophospholipase-like protein [Schizophyllum commune H4-8]
MHRIQFASCLSALPPPCEYFDIIAGSGTGGLIALLLGRLRLSIEHAIECYTRVVSHVFTQIKTDGSLRTTPLEKVLKEISRRFGNGENTPVFETLPAQCKTFVCIREDNGSGNVVSRRIRSYAHPTEPATQFTLVEAIRATMGHPALFKPLSSTKGRTFLDAGDDHYNPAFDIMQELEAIYPTRHLAYYLSIGAGTTQTVGENPQRRFVNQPRLPSSILRTIRTLAERCDAIASAFQREHRDLEGKYFRMTPSHVPSDGKIRWEEAEALEELVGPYFVDVQDQVRLLVVAMMHQTDMIKSRGLTS